MAKAKKQEGASQAQAEDVAGDLLADLWRLALHAQVSLKRPRTGAAEWDELLKAELLKPWHEGGLKVRCEAFASQREQHDDHYAAPPSAPVTVGGYSAASFHGVLAKMCASVADAFRDHAWAGRQGLARVLGWALAELAEKENFGRLHVGLQQERERGWVEAQRIADELTAQEEAIVILLGKEGKPRDRAFIGDRLEDKSDPDDDADRRQAKREGRIPRRSLNAALQRLANRGLFKKRSGRLPYELNDLGRAVFDLLEKRS